MNLYTPYILRCFCKGAFFGTTTKSKRRHSAFFAKEKKQEGLKVVKSSQDLCMIPVYTWRRVMNGHNEGYRCEGNETTAPISQITSYDLLEIFQTSLFLYVRHDKNWTAKVEFPASEIH